MADEYILKSYDGGAQKTTLTASFTIGALSLTVSNGSTFPDGSSGPFVIVVDRGLASEEKFLIDTTTGVNGTTFNIQQAGYDGSSLSAHSSGATVEHCLDAYSIEQANRYVNLQTARGDLVTHNGTTTSKIAIGANNSVLTADSTTATGNKWSLVGSASLAAGSVLEDKIADSAVTNTKLASASVTADKIAAGAIPAAVPVGVISPYAGATAPTDWLLCDGTAVSRTTYAALFAVTGTLYGVGNGTTTFNLPNLKGRVPVAVDTTISQFNTRGLTGGSRTHTLVWDEMPQHNHVVGADIDGRSTDLFIQGKTQPPGEGWALSNTATIGARASTATGLAGASLPHNNLQPYLVVNYIIKI